MGGPPEPGRRAGGRNCSGADRVLPPEEPGWRAGPEPEPVPRRSREATALLAWLEEPTSTDPCVLGRALFRATLLFTGNPGVTGRDQGDLFLPEPAGPRYHRVVLGYLSHPDAYVLSCALSAAAASAWQGAHPPTLEHLFLLATRHPRGAIRNGARHALGRYRRADPRLAEAYLVGLGEPDPGDLRNAVLLLHRDLGKYQLAFTPSLEARLAEALRPLAGHPHGEVDGTARRTLELLAAPVSERRRLWTAQRGR